MFEAFGPSSAGQHLQVKKNNRRAAILVPSLADYSAQDDDIVLLTLLAAALAANADFEQIVIIAVDGRLDGWQRHHCLFSENSLKKIDARSLPVASPRMAGAVGAHEAVYNTCEYLRQHEFDEVHALDHTGLLHYATLTRSLGLGLMATELIVHVVGGSVFRQRAQDLLITSTEPLIADVFERGALERADTIFVHDSLAWQWWRERARIEPQGHIVECPMSPVQEERRSFHPVTPKVVIFYGVLSVEGGLPLFCDAIDRLQREEGAPGEIHMVGPAAPIGGMDALSYIHTRAARWQIAPMLHRNLSLPDEIDLLHHLNGVVHVDVSHRESLRARLLSYTSLPLLRVGGTGGCAAKPGQIVQAYRTTVKDSNTPVLSGGQLAAAWIEAHQTIVNPRQAAEISPLQSLAVGKQPKITVCIAHHNRPDKLRQALASLREQTYRNFEVIVVDDGSNDPDVHTELDSIADELEQQGWRLIRQENQYLGAARNTAARHASGDYLLFMDDDNLAKANELDVFAAVAARTDADICVSFIDVFWSDAHIAGDEAVPFVFAPLCGDETLGSLTNCFGDANSLYKRSTFERLGGYTEDYGITHEDWEFHAKAALSGQQVVCIPERLFWYRLDQEGMLRGTTGQLRRASDLCRHTRPYLEHLPYASAKIHLLVQGLLASAHEISETVGAATRNAKVPLQALSETYRPFARVAVITRTKDRPLMLRRAIQSLLGQNFRDWLHVIVNDGGDPLLVDAVVTEAQPALGQRVLVIHNPVSTGMQNASNIAIARCDSEFIIIHDDDDSWEPQFLARTVSHLDERGWDGQLGGVVTWSNLVIEQISDKGEIVINDRYIFNDQLLALSLRELAVENRFPPISFLLHRAVYDSVGAFDQRADVLGDWDFHLRVLSRFDIDVIPEALANYHHRSADVGGSYGNSVHAQRHDHIMRRQQLLNRKLRESAIPEHPLTAGESPATAPHALAGLLLIGDLQHSLTTIQKNEFQGVYKYLWDIEQNLKQRLDGIQSSLGTLQEQGGFQGIHDYLWAIEQAQERRTKELHQTLNVISSHSAANADSNQQRCGRNLIHNGDFRLWPHNKPLQDVKPFSPISSNLLVSYDAKNRKFSIERRRWQDNGHELPVGKTYLHVAAEAPARSAGTYFMLEFVIPSALVCSGSQVCVSALARMQGQSRQIILGGRHFLGDQRTVDLPATPVVLNDYWTPWYWVFDYPLIPDNEVCASHQHRIFLLMPIDCSFRFDLTNMQVEAGSKPSTFEYL